MTKLDSDAQAILAVERQALDHWAQGRARQYFDHWAEDVTYFDDLGAGSRIDGLPAMRAYAASLEGKIPPHRYELVDPKVQVFGDIGIVTLRYEPFSTDGAPLQPSGIAAMPNNEWSRRAKPHWDQVGADARLIRERGADKSECHRTGGR